MVSNLRKYYLIIVQSPAPDYIRTTKKFCFALYEWNSLLTAKAATELQKILKKLYNNKIS